VIIERSMSSPWLSKAYLVAGDHRTDAVLIDAGGPVEPLLAMLEAHRQCLTHLLLARDDDGGTKARVRWSSDADGVVPGARVQLNHLAATGV
jgi:hypothetical protein